MIPNKLMQVTRRCYLVIFFSSTFMYVSAQTNPEVLTNQSIIALIKADLDKSTILTTINNASNTKFSVSTTAIINLKKQGVHSEIINAMIERSGNQGSGTANIKRTQPAPALNSNLQMINHLYYLNKSNKTEPLEKVVAGLKTKRKALGYGGVSLQYEIEGAKASIRVLKNDSVSFLMNTAAAALPELVLYKLDVEKEKRTVVGVQYKTFGGMKSGSNVITFNTIALGNGIFKISPSKKLEAGEYFFGGKPVQTATAIDVFTFGVE